jgi:plasmid stabilization system protein ParE
LGCGAAQDRNGNPSQVTKSLVIEDAAFAELREATAWYAERRSGLGSEFFDEVLETLELIQHFPALGAVVPRVSPKRRVRRLPLRRFPYSIVYRDEETEIQVIAVAHHRRKPGYWSSR